MISPRRSQLLFHFVVIDLQGAQFKLKLICLGLITLNIALEFLNFLLTLTVHLVEPNHFTLVLLELTCGVLQILQQRLCLFFVCVQQMFGFTNLQGEVLLLRDKTIICALQNVYLQFHLRVLFLHVLHIVAQQVKCLLDLLRALLVVFELTAL